MHCPVCGTPMASAADDLGFCGPCEQALRESPEQAREGAHPSKCECATDDPATPFQCAQWSDWDE